MKLLLIDNHDSFTYNLLNFLREITPNITIVTYSDLVTPEVSAFDKILISPGPGRPEEYPKIRKVFLENTNKPILGVCLGHQILAQTFGAKTENISPVHGQPREISLTEPARIFKDLPPVFVGGLYHSWTVSKQNFPDTLQITAFSRPEKYIMAIQHRKFPFFGLQFHPESYISEYGRKILENFLNL